MRAFVVLGTIVAIAMLIGFVKDDLDSRGGMCKAQIVEWQREGQSCTFVPVKSVLVGRLVKGVCVTGEVGGNE